MPRPNFVEIFYYPISRQGKRGPKTLLCVPMIPNLTPREVANRSLVKLPGKNPIIKARGVYRRASEIIDPPMLPIEIKAWRQAMGFTTSDAARELGVTRRAIQYYESGERPVPGPIAKLCKWIECDNFTNA